MIESYQYISRFIPGYFNKRTGKEQLDILQGFVNFLCKELGLLNNYTILSNETLEDGAAEFNGVNGTISVNITKTNSYRLCCAIIHELVHAQQFEINENNPSRYINAKYPVNNNMLYIFQETEQEAFIRSIDEMHFLFDYFNSNNSFPKDELKILKKSIECEKDTFLSLFKNARKLLEKAKIVDKRWGVTPYNYKGRLDSSKIDALMARELTFVKDRNDSHINEYEYLCKSISLPNLIWLNYKIRNKDGRWNINLSLSRKGNEGDPESRQLNFVLDNNICRINQVLFNNGETGRIKGRELMKYLNAFISLYPEEIKQIQLSDFAYNLNYFHTREFIEKNSDSPSHDNFIIKPDDFLQEEYDEALEKLKNSLSLENIIKLNSGKNNFSIGHEVDIIK